MQRLIVLSFLTGALLAGPKADNVLHITSLPDGATVEWNRKVIGVTPLDYKLGEYAFNASKSSLLSKHLSAPVVLRVSKEGYVPKELTITGPQLIWRSFDGRNAYLYWVIPSNIVNVALDKIAAKPAHLTNADVLKMKAAGIGDALIIDRIQNMPAAFKLEMDDILELHKAGISDEVIQAMMHAK